jgi:NAD(P)-dependent dehydrogenase (short-subunit alcohol dehydrogenase family)
MTSTEQRRHGQGTEDNGVRGRVALVTGGTRGIGEAISRRLAAQGADIAVGYWRGDERAHEYQIEMKTDFPDCKLTLHKGNVGLAEHCREVIRDVIDQHGRLDVLVNNAGITMDRTVAKMTDDQWQKVLDVNLSGAFYLSQAAMEHMLTRGTGRIIDISSVIGETGNIGQANYAASKSGLFGLTKSLALEAAFQLKRSGHLGEGIGLTVNAVTPGFVATEMLATVPENVLEAIREQVPLRRLGLPDEIARAVCFLAADESAYITGQTWAVNGGLDM